VKKSVKLIPIAATVVAQVGTYVLGVYSSKSPKGQEEMEEQFRKMLVDRLEDLRNIPSTTEKKVRAIFENEPEKVEGALEDLANSMEVKCEFCGNTYKQRGIKNHLRYCKKKSH
jgi:hypothetical protein